MPVDWFPKILVRCSYNLCSLQCHCVYWHSWNCRILNRDYCFLWVKSCFCCVSWWESSKSEMEFNKDGASERASAGTTTPCYLLRQSALCSVVVWWAIPPFQEKQDLLVRLLVGSQSVGREMLHVYYKFLPYSPCSLSHLVTCVTSTALVHFSVEYVMER